MMYHASITKSISVSEMMHLREQGKSNAEIADICGCHKATVYNMIGKQPAGIRKPYKPRSPVKSLPKLEEKQTPVHVPFAERCEQAWQVKSPEAGDKAMAVLDESKPVESVEVPVESKPVGRAAETPVDVPDGECRVSIDLATLRLVFGDEAVRGYLKISAWECMRRGEVVMAEDFVEVLRGMENGA